MGFIWSLPGPHLSLLSGEGSAGSAVIMNIKVEKKDERIAFLGKFSNARCFASAPATRYALLPVTFFLPRFQAVVAEEGTSKSAATLMLPRQKLIFR